MNDQQQSRADALTDRQRRIMDEAAKHLTAWLDTDSCDCDGYGHSCGRPNVVRTRDELLELLAAPPAEQPAAAPIDTPTDREFALSAAICVHPKGVYGDEGGSMCCPITHTRDASFAPSPADERAALAKLRAEMFDWLASCTKEHIDGKIEFINRVTEGFAAIYARAVASPAAVIPKRGDDEDA
ncbi:hypothetical protein KTE54_23685 [Burkholderia multivorans]|nr:hypothetical protein [Burkholderia multivorans]MBU9563685.1 hypothetical protein [Burkholderia multivorans]